jgi:DDE superfamily endonuclease
MYYTTGFSGHEIEDLCALIAEIQESTPAADRREWPPILGLGNSVVITLTYLRRNGVQCELAETYGVSQSTVSRAITTITPLLARALARYIPTAEELRPRPSVHRGRNAASLLVMGVRAGPVLRQA